MSATPIMQTNTYTVDSAHSSVNFWARHLMISKVHGQFSKVTGSVVGNLETPEVAVIDIVIEADSLTTGNEQRDGHLKSADFLDVEQFPEIRFQSKKVQSLGDGKFSILGDLTMHGISNQVTLDAELTPETGNPSGGYKIGASATTKIHRESFGMSWNQALEAGGWLVGQEIHIEIDLELDRPV